MPTRLLEHLWYTMLVAGHRAGDRAARSGACIGHTGRGPGWSSGLANALRALPTLGLLILLLVRAAQLPAHRSARPAIAVLVILAVPPILSNTYAGIANVDPAARDAAQGMGMTGAQVLIRVELPVALPLIIVRRPQRLLQVVATATIAALVALGGFGRYVIDGLAQPDYPMMVAGAILVALLAIIGDLLVAGLRAPRLPGRPRRRPARAGSGRPDQVLRHRTEPRRRVPGETDQDGHHPHAHATDRPRRPRARGPPPCDLTACGGSATRWTAAPARLRFRPRRGAIVIGSANFPESALLANIYAAALKAKGVERRAQPEHRQPRGLHQGLQDGSIDLVPEYSGVLLQYFDPNATAISAGGRLHRAAGPLPPQAEVLEKSAAEDKDAVVVTKETADANNLKSIADLAPVPATQSSAARRSGRPGPTACPG